MSENMCQPGGSVGAGTRVHLPGGCRHQSVALACWRQPPLWLLCVADPRLWRRLLPASVEDLAPQLEKPEKLAEAPVGRWPLNSSHVARAEMDFDYGNCPLEE